MASPRSTIKIDQTLSALCCPASTARARRRVRALCARPGAWPCEYAHDSASQDATDAPAPSSTHGLAESQVTLVWAETASGMSSLLTSLSPDPLENSSYPSEHGNFLCWRYLGTSDAGDNYPLPCRAARDGYSAELLDRFVISAWWPPTLNVLHEYVAAGFNTVLTGNIMGGCQHNGTSPALATANDTFECIAAALPLIDRLGLKAVFNLGGWVSSGDPSSFVLGPADGGVTDNTNMSRPHYLTTPEIAWLVAELQRRNMSAVVGAIELHDDVTVMANPTAATISWLRDHAPWHVPLSNAGASPALYASRQVF